MAYCSRVFIRRDVRQTKRLKLKALFSASREWQLNTLLTVYISKCVSEMPVSGYQASLVSKDTRV